MFALILWTETNETDVMSLEHVKKRKGEIVAKWGNGWFPAKIVKKSENKHWLESLDVTTEGEIVTPEKRWSISSGLMAERRKHRQLNKEKESQKKDVIADYNKQLMKTPSIFEDDSEESDEDQVTNRHDFEAPDSLLEDESSNHENNDKSTHNKNIDHLAKDEPSNHGNGGKKLHEAKLNICVCANIPLVSREDLEKLNQVLALARAIHVVQSNLPEVALQENHDVVEQKVVKNEPDDIQLNTEIELIKGSGIIVNAWKLRSIKNLHSKNAREMARKLMKLIIGVEKLKKSSPTGKNGRYPIPTVIFEGVEQFVNENVAKKKYRISHKEYRETMTAMCATLRNPKPKAEDLKMIATLKREQEAKPDGNIDRENLEKDLEELSDDDLDQEIEEIQKEKRSRKDKKRDRATNAKHQTLDVPKQPSQKKPRIE